MIQKKRQYELLFITLLVIVCGYLVVQKVERSEAEETKVQVSEALVQQQEDGEEQEEPEKEAEVIQTSITAGQYPIMGNSEISVSQMVSYFQQHCNQYPTTILGKGGASSIEEFCQIYYEEAEKEGVRAEVAFAQTMKETGWLQYGGDAAIEQYNFAGIGTTGGGVPGNRFADVRTGVRAQIQHLKAYATKESLNETCVDERYEYVKKGSAPYVEWLGQQENPAGCGWATGKNYGYDIVEMIGDMKKI